MIPIAPGGTVSKKAKRKQAAFTGRDLTDMV